MPLSPRPSGKELRVIFAEIYRILFLRLWTVQHYSTIYSIQYACGYVVRNIWLRVADDVNGDKTILHYSGACPIQYDHGLLSLVVRMLSDLDERCSYIRRHCFILTIFAWVPVKQPWRIWAKLTTENIYTCVFVLQNHWVLSFLIYDMRERAFLNKQLVSFP